MRRLLIILSILAFGLVPRSAPAASASNVVPGSALVRFAPGTPAALMLAAHARAGARLVRTIPVIGYDVVAFDPSLPLDAVLASYRNDPSVAMAEPNVLGRIAAAPNDPCFAGACAGRNGQWSLPMTNAFAAWSDGGFTASQKRALPRITVAVLDTKIDASHPDFANPGSSSTDARDGGQLDLVNARDWVPASQQSGAALYHGTYVAGLVAASTGNGAGVASIGSRATILPLTVVDGAGRAEAAALADAIVYAWQRGARVINLSLGLTEHSQAVRDAIRAVTTGANPSLVVAAAGNNTGSAPFYPGSYPESMSVSGTSPSDDRATCSNHNVNVSVAAPAEYVTSLNYGGGTYAPPCGTSAAAPQVSALAALLFAQDAARTPAQVRALVERSADDLGAAGRDDRFGHGRINVERALHSGPMTTLPRATVPPAPGASSMITASASASSAIRAARVFLGSPDATPVALSAADGSFSSPTEWLRGSLTIPATLAAGPHPIYVQAFDGAVWGPKAVGVVVVDGRAPTISGPAATNAVRATGQAATITFTLGDDTAKALILGIQVFDAGNKEVFRDSRTNVPLGAGRYDWTPAGAILPGTYSVKIIAVDQAGKSSAAMVGTVVA